MNILVLGGQSARHKKWVREVAKTLQPIAEEIRILDYAHWENNEADIDITHEIAAVSALTKDFSEYIVVAKSVGTVVTCLAKSQSLITPKACLFMGFPLSTAVAEHSVEVTKGLALLPKTIFLQNTGDPLGNDEEVGKFVVQCNSLLYRIESANFDSHDYVDFERIKKLTQSLIAECNLS